MKHLPKILYLLSTPTPGSGGAAHLATLIRGLSPREYRWDIMCQSDPDSFPIQRHPSGTIFKVPFRDNFDPRSLFKIYRILRREKYDLVHTHLNRAGWLGGMAAALAGVPVVHTVHGLDRPMYSRWADRVIAVSRAARDKLTLDGISGEKIRLVYNGIWVEDFSSSRPSTNRFQLGREGKKPLFIACVVGRLHAAKGQDTAIKALALLTRSKVPARLVLAGDGPAGNSLRQMARDLSLTDLIVFTGDTPYVPELLRSTDVFLLPSLRESCPLSLLEAMASSLPSVVTRIGGIPEMVSHGKEALFIPGNDPPRLAAAMYTLYKHRALVKTMGSAALRRVKDRFHASQMIKETLDVYKELF